MAIRKQLNFKTHKTIHIMKNLLMLILLISFSATAQQKDLYKNKDTGVKAKPVKKVNSSSTNSISNLNKELQNKNKDIEGVYRIIWVMEGDTYTDTYYKYFLVEGESHKKMMEQVNFRYKDNLKDGQKFNFTTTTIKKGYCAIIYSQNINGVKKYAIASVTSDYVEKKKSQIESNTNNKVIEDNLCNN